MAKGNATAGQLGQVIEQGLSDIISEKYLSYALSTIMARSLPDVRDGLKPVHRRLLYAMSQLSLKATGAPKKSARVVGDVIGKFHPHGDQSVYDALVRLAQDFAVRYPLVDGQGNFGNIDGDNAAAMRYTEARLTIVSELLMEGLDEDAVDFRATYDGEASEPIVMPAAFPNLLANGSSGIAVGMATSIPPHNADELCEAMVAMIDGDPTIEELCNIVVGPDFPTGGVMVESRESIVESYKKGRGSFRLRAKWEREELKQGTYQIIVTQIPYQVQKSRLIEKIAELLHERKLPLLEDIRDESAEDVRLVLVPKSRNVEPALLMESLFRTSDLEIKFPLNMNVLENGIAPRVMNLKEVLRAFLDHRQVVLVRMSSNRLAKVENRIEVLQGYLIAYLNLDEIIRIIREEDEPKPVMMQAFGLTDVQAEAILNMRLRSLRKLEEFEIRKEHDTLVAERDELKALIGSESRQWKAIRAQVVALRKKFSKSTELGARRTELAEAPQLAIVPDEAFVEKEPITIVSSQQGWIRAMKGHGLNIADIKYKDGDESRFVLQGQTTDKIMVFATNGRFYTLTGDKLPSGRGFGEPLRMMIDLPAGVEVVSIHVYEPEGRYLVASEDGRGFIVKATDGIAQTRAGKVIMNPDEGVPATVCLPLPANHDHLAVIGTNRKLVVFPLDQIPEMARGKGVILQKYKEGRLSDVRSFAAAEGFTFTNSRGGQSTENPALWLATRAAIGKLPPNGFSKTNKF